MICQFKLLEKISTRESEENKTKKAKKRSVTKSRFKMGRTHSQRKYMKDRIHKHKK